MPATATTALLSIDEYLDGEQYSAIRHEYLAGQVYSMAGASEQHNRLAGNVFFHLRAATRGTACGVFINDMKVRIAAHDSFYYPDVLLTCAVNDSESFYKTAPCFIAEVLSPSTELIDRREKLLAYRTLPSLRYYVLIAQNQRLVELYRRDDQGDWHYQVYQETGELELNCPPVQLRMTLAEVYEDVRFDSV
ncbi:Uma2 family endonuclease [Rhodoferax sp. 4810]|uniref:Uma2 family endonuclease n=1 Tax=Thiospirillum jenense TaxID=1653858 RepID=A0A839H4T3_9GAMM|nr:Uma2 family endonuclease [Thiospirillum jenense]MBB1073125.1 Uma2 family endonuclease [Rhodoferax jenense]MBB1124714.1 Uma2 family endonuclease [Thiospirillum jenense]